MHESVGIFIDMDQLLFLFYLPEFMELHSHSIVIVRLRYELRWRYFIHFLLDKIIPYKKFYINKNKIRKSSKIL